MNVHQTPIKFLLRPVRHRNHLVLNPNTILHLKEYKHLVKRINVVSRQLAAVLDRSQISNSKAPLMVAVTAKSLGHEIDSLSISKESIRCKRTAAKRVRQEEIKASFITNAKFTIHWDGRLLPDFTGLNINYMCC